MILVVLLLGYFYVQALFILALQAAFTGASHVSWIILGELCICCELQPRPLGEIYHAPWVKSTTPPG